MSIKIHSENRKSFSPTYQRLLVTWEFQVKQYVTQVLVTKREAEIKLEQQNFGERKEINRRKEMILSGVDPEQAAEELKEERTKR